MPALDRNFKHSISAFSLESKPKTTNPQCLVSHFEKKSYGNFWVHLVLEFSILFYFFKINPSLSTMGMDTRHAMVMFLVKYDELMMKEFFKTDSFSQSI